MTTVTNPTYSATTADEVILCDTTSNAITVNLPTAVGLIGVRKSIKKISSDPNVATVTANGTEKIDTLSPSFNIDRPMDGITIVSDNVQWWII